MHKKIVILSAEYDLSTTYVMRWLHYINPNIGVVRLHPDFLIKNHFIHNVVEDSFKILINNEILSTEKIGVIWTRKWHKPKLGIATHDKQIQTQLPELQAHLQQEYNSTYNYFIHILQQNKQLYWLNHPQYTEPNKLIQLKKAMQVE
jgi:hypothetical protein